MPVSGAGDSHGSEQSRPIHKIHSTKTAVAMDWGHTTGRKRTGAKGGQLSLYGKRSTMGKWGSLCIALSHHRQRDAGLRSDYPRKERLIGQASSYLMPILQSGWRFSLNLRLTPPSNIRHEWTGRHQLSASPLHAPCLPLREAIRHHRKPATPPALRSGLYCVDSSQRSHTWPRILLSTRS